MKIGPEQNVQMPMKTVISLIIMVALGTFGYFQIQEKLNQHDTLLQMHTKDLDQNSEFRIKYPRGELGQSSGESELFMLVEHMAGQITKMEERMEDMRSNSVNIERLQKDTGLDFDLLGNICSEIFNKGFQKNVTVWCKIYKSREKETRRLNG